MKLVLTLLGTITIFLVKAQEKKPDFKDQINIIIQGVINQFKELKDSNPEAPRPNIIYYIEDGIDGTQLNEINRIHDSIIVYSATVGFSLTKEKAEDLLRIWDEKLDSVLDDTYVKKTIAPLAKHKSKGYLYSNKKVFIYIEISSQIDSYHLGNQRKDLYMVDLDFSNSPLNKEITAPIDRKYHHFIE